MPPFASGLITAAVAFAILALQQRGYRRFERAIAGRIVAALIIALNAFLLGQTLFGWPAGAGSRRGVTRGIPDVREARAPGYS